MVAFAIMDLEPNKGFPTTIHHFFIGESSILQYKKTPFGEVLKRPSYLFGLVQCDWVVFFSNKMLNYLTSHFDWWIVNHLTSQISTLFFRLLLNLIFLCK